MIQDIYGAPTYAMNIATSLKQCCEIAITLTLTKKNPSVASAKAESNLSIISKTIIHLFTSNWRYVISTHAANNFNLNKWNKVTIIQLASDLKLLREYLIKLTNDSLKRLTLNDKDVLAYNTLIETVYCRVILLNRKRPVNFKEVVLLSTYVTSNSEKENYEEFNRAISSTELLQHMKRVLIRGKRGRGVPVLFSPDVQGNITTILKVRSNFVPIDNVYLFAKSGLKTDQWI